MAKIIIGIHGLGNKPKAELLQDWWLRSIKEGLTRINGMVYEKIPFKLVYWADILHPYPENPDIKDPDDPLYLSEPYVASGSNPEYKAEPEKLSSKIIKYIGEQLDNIFLKADMTLNFNNVTDKIIHNYFRDLEVYYSVESMDQNDHRLLARDTIRKRLLDVLKHHYKDDVLLICHSMGSIIAYDVLLTHSNECRANTFVTIGSPLGIPIIVSRIFKEQNSLQVPPNILKWYNQSDAEDLVAMDHTIKDDFPDNRNNITVEDTLVQNDYIINEKRNPHKVYGYLRTAEMAQIITDFLTVERSGFFKHYHNVLDKVLGLWGKTILRRKK